MFSEGDVKSPCFLQVWWVLLCKILPNLVVISLSRIHHTSQTLFIFYKLDIVTNIELSEYRVNILSCLTKFKQ
jgi:hypothetical protein